MNTEAQFLATRNLRPSAATPEIYNIIFRPVLLADIAYQRLTEYDGAFIHNAKRTHRIAKKSMGAYFRTLFQQLPAHHQDTIIDLQDQITDFLKPHLNNLNYAFQDVLMFIPADKRVQICHMVEVSAILQVCLRLTDAISPRHDPHLLTALHAVGQLIDELYRPYQRRHLEASFVKSNRVALATKVFFNQVTKFEIDITSTKPN